MGKKRVAAAHLRGERYKSLVNMEIIDDLATGRKYNFPVSSNLEANGKLPAREVYLKILEGEFFISPPEKTKTSRATVSKCWIRGMKLVVEKDTEGTYTFTG